VIAPSAPAEKFTGAIAVPPAEQKTEPKEEPTEPTEKETETGAATAAAPITYEQPVPVVYQTGSGGESQVTDGSGWIMAYIAVLSAVILVVLVKPKEK
jgi:hypothetical protein